MRLGYGLNLVQSQKLVMTPELRQAITILQLSAQELTTFVDQQLADNPLLETLEEVIETKGAGSEGEKSNSDSRETEILGIPSGFDQGLNWQDYFNDLDDGMNRSDIETVERKRIDPSVSLAPTLQEYLMDQLNFNSIICGNDVRGLVGYIIGNLDERGYLTISLEDIAKEQNAQPSKVQTALEIVQSLEPAGVGARSLEECLLLQLYLLPECPPEMPKFIQHLEDLAAGRIQKIAHTMKISVTQIRELADLVRKLDPKPGLRFFDHRDVRYIIPDVLVEEVDGEYIIMVNDTSIPRLRVNQVYLKILNEDQGSETRKFVEHKLNSAAWLIRSIEQRRLTLYKVANAIVRNQEQFLRHGIRKLKPLTLRDIADEISVHESTVSRATSNKYIQTPRGIFDFKFFFATGLSHSSDVTAEGIKQALKEIIAGEDNMNPYSDQKLSDILDSKGMHISRRTVAKYRDELGLSAASARKRY